VRRWHVEIGSTIWTGEGETAEDAVRGALVTLFSWPQASGLPVVAYELDDPICFDVVIDTPILRRLP
jgi:hypothetical protein